MIHDSCKISDIQKNIEQERTDTKEVLSKSNGKCVQEEHKFLGLPGPHPVRRCLGHPTLIPYLFLSKVKPTSPDPKLLWGYSSQQWKHGATTLWRCLCLRLTFSPHKKRSGSW